MIFMFSLQELLQCTTLINDDIRQKIMSQLDKPNGEEKRTDNKKGNRDDFQNQTAPHSL